MGANGSSAYASRAGWLAGKFQCHVIGKGAAMMLQEDSLMPEQKNVAL